MSDDEENGNGSSKISASLGELTLTVEGSDEEWVKETFEDEWSERLNEAGDMAKALRKAYRGHQ